MDVIWSYFSPTRVSEPATRKFGKAAQDLEATSIQRVVRIFVRWKLLLLLVAIAAPGPGYDTSTRILFHQARGSAESWFARAAEYLIQRLTKWDGIYFATASVRGHMYEQEWVFSWLLSKTTSLVARVLLWPLPLSSIAKHALAGIIVSHASHFQAVTVLYHLIYAMAPATEGRKRQLAFTTACLHVFSPAGLFLSTPNGESTFALVNFLGLLCYVKAIENRFHTFADAYQLDAFWTLGAGLFFALATMVRSNGLLSGLVFAWDAIIMLPRLQIMMRNRDKEELTRLFATFAAGALVALGFAFPQALAYREYCTGDNMRPWCSNLPPSIYSFVQEHYWNVGFLRYWTLSNVPLFLLAAPLGWIMAVTANQAMSHVDNVISAFNDSTAADSAAGKQPARDRKVFEHVMPRFALVQLVLVGLIATSFHVQIINRLSSGYPVWYFMLAVGICANESSRQNTSQQGAQKQTEDDQGLGSYGGILPLKPEWIVKGMVVYAVVQGGLYACFLPPA